MLLSRLNVVNRQGIELNLPFEDKSNGFVVRNIEGLGPVKATLVSSSFANQDGEQYHNARREARDIKIELGLEPDYSMMAVKDLRDQLYNFFMPKSKAKLKFHMFDKFAVSVFKEDLDLEIEARIEDFDAPIFTQDPAVVVSMRCFNPDFVDPILVTFDGMTVADQTDSTINYAGTVETGFVFTLRPDRALSEFTIYNMPPDQTMRTVDFSYPLQAGDVLKISSVPGDKYIKLTRANVETSIVYAVTPQSDWLELQQGPNAFRVYATGAPIPYTVEYTTKYGGL